MPKLYTGYFDESGTHGDSAVVVVAGFISNATKWSEFSEKWEHALLAKGVEYFHMVDFESSHGQFEGWTEDDKRPLLNNLLPLILECAFWSTGCVVLRSDFNSLVAPGIRSLIGDEYGWATLLSWRHLGIILKQNDGWLDCYMESGAEGRHSVELVHREDNKIPEWRDEHRVVRLSFSDKKLAPPLQAADILAYELYKQSARQFGGDIRATRYPLKQLAPIRHQWVYAQQQHLTDLNVDLTHQIMDVMGRSGA